MILKKFFEKFTPSTSSHSQPRLFSTLQRPSDAASTTHLINTSDSSMNRLDQIENNRSRSSHSFLDNMTISNFSNRENSEFNSEERLTLENDDHQHGANARDVRLSSKNAVHFRNEDENDTLNGMNSSYSSHVACQVIEKKNLLI